MLSSVAVRSVDSLRFRERSVASCEGVLYADSAMGLVGLRPVLSPQPIAESIARLDSMLNTLEQAVVDVIRDVDRKKQVC